MLNNLFLTRSEMHRLDVADCHDIVECVPSYKSLSTEVRKDLFLSLMHVAEGQEINPFTEMMLAEGVLAWKEKRYMDDKLTKYVSPERINDAFTRMRDCVEKMQKQQIEVTKVKAELDTAKARLASNPDFKWGKNDTERDAQVQAAFPDLFKKLQTTALDVQKLHDEKEVIQIELSHIAMVIDFFRVFNGCRE